MRVAALPDLRRSIIALLCASLISLFALPVQAARWYRVELLIFQQPQGSGAEQWPAQPQLAYPERFRFLIDQATLATAQDNGVDIDRFGRRVLGEADSSLATAAHNTDNRAADPGDALSTAAGEPEAGSEFGEPQRATERAGQPQPVAFVLGSRDQLEFRGKAAYMERNGGYRVLFHETWLQPVSSRKNSRALVLDRSGDGGPWPQLQGSIRLHLSRYLHLQTNLWLNTPGDYLPGDWRMPPPPRGPASVLDISTPEQPPIEVQTQNADFTPQGMFDPQKNAADQVPAAAGATNDYPFRHAVAMRQKRKMRSNEVHYIDHPLLGLVIKFTPVSWDEEEDGEDTDSTSETTPES